ncbi:MAG: 5-formyltetrahydrofolate cyclo-ligase [Pseudomonadota bacterium]
MGQDKTALRAAVRKARKALAQTADHAPFCKAINRALIEELGKRTGGAVATYMAMGSEVTLDDFHSFLLETSQWIAALPTITDRANGEMEFKAWQHPENLHVGQAGISEPPVDAPTVLPDIVVTPLLAFDANGGRLGQGGGFYDRALASLRQRKQITVIGAAFASQEVKRVPMEPHDATLDAVVTQHGLRYFAR